MVGGTVDIRGVNDALDALRDLETRWTDQEKWIVGVGAEYGAYVEFGTSRNRAQPYFFPAVNHVFRTRFVELENKANSLDEFQMLIAVAIEGEAKKRAPVDTGFLRSSIEAAPAGAMGGSP